jgi:hypothetical protein
LTKSRFALLLGADVLNLEQRHLCRGRYTGNRWPITVTTPREALCFAICKRDETAKPVSSILPLTQPSPLLCWAICCRCDGC